MVEKPKSERASLKHGTVPGADLKQGDGKENNLAASVKHFVSKELFSISPVFTVVSRKGGNNAYAIFVVVFWGEGGGTVG